jgi:hypothetical protein
MRRCLTARRATRKRAGFVQRPGLKVARDNCHPSSSCRRSSRSRSAARTRSRSVLALDFRLAARERPLRNRAAAGRAALLDRLFWKSQSSSDGQWQSAKSGDSGRRRLSGNGAVHDGDRGRRARAAYRTPPAPRSAAHAVRANAREAYLHGLGSARYAGSGLGHLNPVLGAPR